MKMIGGVVKQLRKSAKLSQDKLADKLGMDARQLRRIEDGNSSMDIWQFMTALEVMGYSAEDFWLISLDTDEYEEYRTYRQLKRLLRDQNYSRVREILPGFEKGVLSRQPFIRQFIARVKVKVDADISNEEAITKLYEALQMSIPKFDEHQISKYRLTYNEINIISDLADKLFETGETGRAIAMNKAVIENRKNSRTSEEDRALLFPSLMSNLSTLLGKAGEYKESLKLCEEAIEICREYNNLRTVPILLNNMASCMRLLGEEEAVYKPHLIRAYHCAYAMGNFKTADIIKKDAEEDFGIVIT